MASRSRSLNLAYRPLFSLGFPIFSWSVRHMPLRLLYFLGEWITLIFFFLRPKYARAVRSNFSQILGKPADGVQVRSAARRMGGNHARYWIDFFYWSERGPSEAACAVVDVRNVEALDRCIAARRGCIAMTAHIGNWEMGGLILDRRGVKLAVVYIPDRFDAVEHQRSAYRRKAGVTEIPLTGDPFSALAALRILREGGVVAVQGDRDFDNSGVAVPFFGRPAFFPRGPAVLSLLSGAPILPVFIVRAGRPGEPDAGGFRVIFFDPIEPEGDVRSENAAEAMTRRSVSAIEATIREYPDQWYCFYPFWEDPTRGTAPTAET